jgi:hypothetical protein
LGSFLFTLVTSPELCYMIFPLDPIFIYKLRALFTFNLLNVYTQPVSIFHVPQGMFPFYYTGLRSLRSCSCKQA